MSFTLINRNIKFILFAVLILLLAFIRYRGENCGFPAWSWDYGAHIGIINHILSGHLFPDFYKSEISVHLVSKWLPVYHGIIGSHLIATIFVGLGLSIPKAMLLTSDLSFFVLVFALWKIGQRSAIWFFLVVLFFVFPAYAVMANQGFYSLCVGSALGLLGISYIVDKDSFKKGFCILVVSIICYPDIAIWLAFFSAYLLYNKSERGKISNYKSYLLLLVGVYLYVSFYFRSFLGGGIVWPLYYIIFLALMLVYVRLFEFEIRLKKIFGLSFSYFCISASLITIQIILFKDFNVDYYLKKYTFWSVLFLASLALSLRRVHVVVPILLIGSLICNIDFRQLYMKSVMDYTSAKSAFTGQDEAAVKEIISAKECPSYFFVDREFDPKNAIQTEGIYIRNMAFYSYTNQYDLSEAKVSFVFPNSIERKTLYQLIHKMSEMGQSIDKNLADTLDSFRIDNNKTCFVLDNSRFQRLNNYSDFKVLQGSRYSMIYHEEAHR